MTYPYLKQFEKYVMPVTESGCWIWLGHVNKYGYGKFNPKYRTPPLYAHRVSYEIYKGQIPEGMFIDHLCRLRCCVNPDHLEPVTQHENLLRGIGTASRNFKPKTHCKNGHQFLVGNFYTRGRTRVCLICDSKRGKEKYRRNRAMGKAR